MQKGTRLFSQVVLGTPWHPSQSIYFSHEILLFLFFLIQFVCFILPAAFALRLHSNERLILTMFERLAAWSLALGGFIVGVLSTYVTILEIVQG